VSGRSLYDWWSRHRVALRGLYAVAFFGRGRTVRRRSVAALDLQPGDRVLELGCGPGNSFERLRDAVGPDGTVVGIDYSEGMVDRATDRVARAGWDNVHVVLGDATRPPVLPGSFDGVYAAMSLSAMPNPVAAVEAAAAALASDGRLAVLDARPFQSLPWSLTNPLVVPILARLTDWDHETDIPAAIDERFEQATLSGYNGGNIYVSSASGPLTNG